jgi:hypothetical protein
MSSAIHCRALLLPRDALEAQIKIDNQKMQDIDKNGPAPAMSIDGLSKALHELHVDKSGDDLVTAFKITDLNGDGKVIVCLACRLAKPLSHLQLARACSIAPCSLTFSHTCRSIWMSFCLP